jgi:ligand-binding sensor domain-containing protein
MKKYYFAICLLLTLAGKEVLAQQPTWTVYNDSNSALPDNFMTCIAVDQSGTVWAGSNYYGLCKFNGTAWTYYDDFNSNINYYSVDDILVDNSNKVWVGTYKGISVFNGTTFTNYDTINAGFKGQSVYKMDKDNTGKIWISSQNGSFGNAGITVYDGVNWNNIDQSGLPSQVVNEEINGYVFGANNDVWMGTDNGMLFYNGTAFTYYPPAVTELWSAGAIAKDADGNIWAGGFDGLLKRDVTNNTWTFYENVSYLGFPSANVLYFDILPDGDFLWLATSDGFLKFNRKTGAVIANYKDDNSPLQENGVYDIAKDNSGNLWLASTVGVVKMSFATGIEDKTAEAVVNVYPNLSSNGMYNLEARENTRVSYKVFSIDGALIRDEASFAGRHRIDLSDAARGLYLLYTTSASGAVKVTKLKKD